MSNLLGLEHVSGDAINQYLDLAEEFLSPDGRPQTPPSHATRLAGKSVGLLFFEPSTRTRTSFELAVHRLGGYPVSLDLQSSSITKGETELDTCRNLAAMGVDAFVIRHSDRHLPARLADDLGLPVLNAGNGVGEHPTQALLDSLALRRAFGRKDLSGLKVAIIGDIIHSRVARSDVYAFTKLGAKVTLAGPPKLMPSHGWDVTIAGTRREALADADAVVVLRIQKERFHDENLDNDAYVRDWGIDELVLDEEMKPDAFVLHPGPVIRGVELTSAVADSPRSLILKQAGYGVAVRQAVLTTCLGD